MFDSDWLDDNEDISLAYKDTPTGFKFTDKDIPDSLLKDADLKALYPGGY